MNVNILLTKNHLQAILLTDLFSESGDFLKD